VNVADSALRFLRHQRDRACVGNVNFNGARASAAPFDLQRSAFGALIIAIREDNPHLLA
jgi:hypothetical protein